VAAAALAVALLGHRAEAQRAGCGALLREGVSLRRERRDVEAWERFDRAWSLCRSPEALADRGLAALALARWEDGARDLEEALTHAADPFIRAWGSQLRGELSRALEHRAPRAAAPTLVAASMTAPVVAAPLHPAPVAPRSRRVFPTRWAVSAGVSLAVGVAAQLTQQWLIARWNDDACLAGGRTRRENCAPEGVGADALQGVAVAGFVAAGALAAIALSQWLRSPRTSASWSCAPTREGAWCVLRF